MSFAQANIAGLVVFIGIGVGLGTMAGQLIDIKTSNCLTILEKPICHLYTIRGGITVRVCPHPLHGYRILRRLHIRSHFEHTEFQVRIRCS